MGALFDAGDIPHATRDPRQVRLKHRRRPATVELSDRLRERRDRKSTRLNSSHLVISYAVFCLKKKNTRHSHASIAALQHGRIWSTMASLSGQKLFTIVNPCSAHCTGTIIPD